MSQQAEESQADDASEEAVRRRFEQDLDEHLRSRGRQRTCLAQHADDRFERGEVQVLVRRRGIGVTSRE